jgi:hypothetical protein
VSNPDNNPIHGLHTLPASVASSWASTVCELVNQRYEELGNFQRCLEKRSRRLHLIGWALKVLLIVLGALSATKATFSVLDPGAQQGIAIYAIFGALTTITAGLSAGFKPEESGGKLAGLAAECASTRNLIRITWEKILLEHGGTLAAVTADKSEVRLIEDLLERLNVKTGDIYTRAAGLGVEPPNGPPKLREFGELTWPSTGTSASSHSPGGVA